MSKKVTLPNGSEVEWLGDNLLLLLEEASLEALTSSAFAIEGGIKREIVKNDQVDTAFMLNSVYVATPEQSTYEEAKQKAMGQVTASGEKRVHLIGKRKSRKSGRWQDVTNREVLEEVKPETLNEEGVVVIVAVGAEYAVYQEMQQPFIYPALVAEAQEVGGKLVEQAKKRGA